MEDWIYWLYQTSSLPAYGQSRLSDHSAESENPVIYLERYRASPIQRHNLLDAESQWACKAWRPLQKPSATSNYTGSIVKSRKSCHVTEN